MSIKVRCRVLYGVTVLVGVAWVLLSWHAAVTDGDDLQGMNIWQRVAGTIMAILCIASIVIAVQVPMFNCWRAGYEAGREQRERESERERPNLRVVRSIDA